ncbi:hypothetical protein LCGC14_1132960 [marine sediment metagenome]|uniref:Uncharacterized protein n=1 Tax=marine sediment metagenome TaxID=412755 RepID=A0A0F9Q6C1_9ZZZZ
MTHTPGPWEVGPRGKYHQQHYRTIIVEDPLLGTDEVAWVICDWDETEPDAALIAAAPELLEACKALLETFEGYEMLAALDLSVQEQAMAATAKAEGRINATSRTSQQGSGE